jgi:autotransporter-associated beta strand protein
VEAVFNDAATLLRTLEIGSSGATLHVANAAGAIAFQRPTGVSGAGTIRKTGPGVVRMQASSSGLAANWILEEGVLEVGAADALGTGNVIVQAGLLASRNVTVNTPVILQGGGLGTRSGDAGDFTGPVTVNAASDIFLRSYTTPAQARILTVSGLLSGAGDLRIEGNANPTDFPFIVTNPANTYSGTFRVAPGQILMSRPQVSGNPLGTGSVLLTDSRLMLRNDGFGDNGTVPFGNGVTIAGTTESRIDVDRSGAVALGNTLELGSLSIGSQKLVVTGANQYRLAFSQAVTLTQAPIFEPATADLALHGDITGAFGFTKTGAGRLTIDGLTTFTGAVTVQAGTMQWNATTADLVDALVSGGTLAGTGTIGDDLTFAGVSTFEPGDALRGIFQVNGDLTLSAGSTTRFDIAHANSPQPVPGSDYAQLRVGGLGGTVSLNDAPLSLTLGGGVVENDLFFLILNDGLNPVSGTFAGLPQDSLLNLGGQLFQISYTANVQGQSLHGGNDIALQAVPEPGSLILLAGGFVFCASVRRRPSACA